MRSKSGEENFNTVSKLAIMFSLDGKSFKLLKIKRDNMKIEEEITLFVDLLIYLRLFKLTISLIMFALSAELCAVSTLAVCFFAVVIIFN